MANSDIENARFNASISAKLRTEAKKRGVAADPIRKQYIFTILLGRFFGEQETPPWVLLGGNALLIRTGGGRFTQDIDLARESDWGTPEEVRSELQELADQGSARDPFTFAIGEVEPHSEPDQFGYGGKTAKVAVQAMLGTKVFETFSIDLTTRRHIDAPVDQVPLRPIIEHETLHNLPAVPTTPAENHLADKVCAMYEKHGTDAKPSTRYRDLADIVRLAEAVELDAERLSTVLRREAERRKMALPARLEPPAAEWALAFSRDASTYAEYPKGLHTLDASLQRAGGCLNPVLSGEVKTGTWRPDEHVWATNAEAHS